MRSGRSTPPPSGRRPRARRTRTTARRSRCGPRTGSSRAGCRPPRAADAGAGAAWGSRCAAASARTRRPSPRTAPRRTCGRSRPSRPPTSRACASGRPGSRPARPRSSIRRCRSRRGRRRSDRAWPPARPLAPDGSPAAGSGRFRGPGGSARCGRRPPPGRPPAPRSGCTPPGSGAPPPRRSRSPRGRRSQSARARPSTACARRGRPPRGAGSGARRRCRSARRAAYPALPRLSRVRRILIVGSTGSIGTQALEGVERSDELELVGLAAASSWETLLAQADRFAVPRVALADQDAAARAAEHSGIDVLAGPEGLVELITETDCDLVLNALVGSAGLGPTVAALGEGIDLALANKESLVVGGELVTQLAEATGARILPVDSEHSALWQLIRGERPGSVERLVLTASGGPFRGRAASELE